jgi:hypothetical protein
MTWFNTLETENSVLQDKKCAKLSRLAFVSRLFLQQVVHRFYLPKRVRLLYEKMYVPLLCTLPYVTMYVPNKSTTHLIYNYSRDSCRASFVQRS